MIEVEVRAERDGFRLDAAFTTRAGIAAVFGPSGSGKSTLIGLIAGLLRPRAGRIVVDGRVLVDTAAGVVVPARKRRAGLVFQEALLFPHLSVRQNLLYGRWLAGRRASEISFDEVLAVLGIEALLGRRPATLSGGERQRVAIGRALLAQPRILLMDEPLASLDAPRKAEILGLVRRVHEAFRTPILYVSHAPEEVAAIAAEVVLLEAGRVVGQGTANDLLPALQRPDPRLSARLSVRVAERDRAFGLSVLRHPAGRLYLPGVVGDLGTVVDLEVPAEAVALTREPGTSTDLSVLAGTVTAIEELDPGRVLVAITLEGGDHLAAAVLRRGFETLQLTPGSRAFAAIRAARVLGTAAPVPEKLFTNTGGSGF